MFGSAALRPKLGGAVAAVAVAAVAAGCSAAGSSSTTPPASSPATSASSTASAAGASASPSAASGSSTGAPSATPAASGAAAGASGCTSGDLRVKPGVGQGAAGSTYQVIDFTNTSSASCTLYGYPGVSLTTGTAPGTQVGAAAERSTAAGPSVVKLAAGQTANALLRITQALNYPTSTCSPTKTAYLQIFPPNQTAAIYMPYSTTGCSQTSVKLLMIGVVQAGAGSGS